MKSAKAAIELLRPNVCAMAVLGLAIAAIIFGINIFSIQFALAAIAAFLICGGGNAINDYFDYKIDKINMPKRPLPSGRISRKSALYLFWIVSAVGLALSYLVNHAFLAIALFNFIISSLYAWKLKRTVIKGIFVAYLGSSAFISAPFISGFPSSLLSSALLLLILISFFGTLSRQLLMDIRDMEGDKKAGAKTIPLIFGKKTTKIIASAFLLLAASLLVAPYLQKMVSVYYLVLAVPAIALSLYAIIQEPKRGERTIKMATFLVLFAFLVGTILI
ncbi:MAG: UbiA family prenyltransferase [Candidatus Aenigmatarchaeota archaeon]